MWGVWHLPIWLWSSLSGGAAFAAEFALFVVALSAFSVVFTQVYNRRTGASMWMVVVLHASFTASFNGLAVALGPQATGTWVPILLTTASACVAAALTAAFLGEWGATTGAPDRAQETAVG